MTDPQTPEIPPLTPEQVARYEKLRAWRRRVAMARAVAPFIIFSNRVLEEVARWAPTTLEELAALHGIGPAKLAAYGRRCWRRCMRRWPSSRPTTRWCG